MPIRDAYITHHNLAADRTRSLSDANRDFHIIRGGSVNLSSMLVVLPDGGDWTMHSAHVPAGAEVLNLAFDPRFRHAVTAGNIITGPEGVTIDTTTGVINTVAAPPVADRISNFNFVVAIRLTGTGAQNGLVLSAVRVFVHDSIQHAWLSPPQLRVRRGMLNANVNETGARFSVYAEFDDGEVADVSHLQANIAWQVHANIDTATGNIRVNNGDAEGAVIAAPVQAQVTFGTMHVAQGTLFVDRSWAAPNNFQVESMRTNEATAFARRNEVPNVLFICDGFMQDPGNPMNPNPLDQAAFDNAVMQMINRMSGDYLVYPYNRFADQVNFWRVFTTSTERGLSYYSYAFFDPASAPDANGDRISFQFYEVDTRIAGAAPVPANTWEIGDLLFAIGLPAGTLPPLTPGAPAAEWTAFKNALIARYNVTDAELNDIPRNTLLQWRNQLVTRFLPNEKDTFFGTYWGRKPRAANPIFDADPTVMSASPNRLTRGGLDNFLSRAVTRNSGQSLAGIWNQPSGFVKPKDYDLVVLIFNSEGGREMNSDGFFLLNINSAITRDFTVLTGAGVADPVFFRTSFLTRVDAVQTAALATSHARFISAQSTLTPYDPADATVIPVYPTTFNNLQYGTFLHELSHSFGLEDEYSEDAFQALQFPQSSADVLPYYGSNVQAHVQMENAGTHALETDRIKWKWDRIRQVGITTAIGSHSSNVVTLQLTPGHSANFAVGQKVKLRQRLPGVFQSEDMEVSAVNPGANPSIAVHSHSSHLSENITRHFGKGRSHVFIRISTGPNTGLGSAWMNVNGPVTYDGVVTYTIPVVALDAAFIVGTVCRLITAYPPALNQFNFATDTMTIDNITGNTVRLRVDTPGSIIQHTLNSLPAGSLLYQPIPVPAADALPTYQYYQLTWKNVLQEMQLQNQPLNGVFAAPPPPLNHIDPQDPIPLFDAVYRDSVRIDPDLKRKAVGLFRGGVRFAQGLYHPTGFCKMRNSGGIQEFCAVCRYVLIDYINPTLHRENDDLIQNSYPVDVIYPNP